MPNNQPSVPERAALLALMTFVTEASNTDIQAQYGFTIDKDVRDKLEQQGLITCHRADAVPGRPYVHDLTEQGWRWCRDELGAAPPEKASKGYRLLYGVLNSLDRHMRKSKLAMEHVFSVAAEADVEKRIRATYEELVAEPGGWVALRRLRERLADLSRDDVDEALMFMDLQPGVFLEPEVNQKTLSDADWSAAIRIGGEPKHLLSIKRS
jgi:hypothetical protein